jgi:predicted RNA-binding Zn-ribbon protein involved in translation (DUF1610 family)
MTLEAQALTCPSCGSAHLVEEDAARYLCLDCHGLSQRDANSQSLVADQRLCPHCGAENAERATTCATCGEGLKPQCLKCGAQMAVWHATCPRCGTDQAAYREQLAAQERDRQRQLAEQRTAQRRQQPTRRRYGRRPWSIWRIGWLIWPLIWMVSWLGRSLRGGVETLSANGLDLALPAELSGQTLSLAVGACIFSVGVIVLLVSAIPSIFRSD